MQTKSADLLVPYLEMERELDLFSARERGIPYWELLRYPVYAKVTADSGIQDFYLTGRSHSLSQVFRNLHFIVLSLTSRSPFRRGPCDLLILGSPKRTLADGLYQDIYTNPLLRLVGNAFKARLLERPFGTFVHKRPTPAPDVTYLDAVYALSIARSKILLPRLSAATEDLCVAIAERIQAMSGMTLNVVQQLRVQLARWQVEVPLFRILLRMNKPRALFLVISSGNETLIAAAKQLGIPTVELQHGSPAPGKLNYDFPAGLWKETFPDFFFSFGSFWSKHLHLPLPEENILPLGFAHMAEVAARYSNIERRQQILFISQRTIGRRLAAFAMDLRQRLGNQIPIVYKLHPEEVADWRTRYPGLEDCGIRVAHKPSEDLYGLFAASTWQIGVYSTALYEGIAFGCQTFVIKAPGWEAMNPLIRAGAAKLLESAADFKAKPPEAQVAPLTKDYFAEINHEKVVSYIERVISDGAC